jgi:hypothetical protein
MFKRTLLSLSILAILTSQPLADSDPAGSLPADFNADNTVDFNDFFLFVEQFGQSCSNDCSALTADLDSNQSVTFADFFLFVEQFGQTFVPLLITPQNQTVALGSTLSLQLTPTARAPIDLAFFVGPLPLPTNARFEAQSGSFTFTPTPEQAGQSFSLLFGASSATQYDCYTIVITVPGQADQAGPSGLSGRILDAQTFVEEGIELPIVGATVSLLNTQISVVTDDQGHFALGQITADSLILDINPSTAAPGPDGAVYAGFREQIALLSGVENIVSRPFYLPRLETASSTVIIPDNITIVNNERLGIALNVPANSARDASGELYTGALTISEVPENLAPAALPDNLQPGVLVTIQPVGIRFDPPAPITFPNLDNAPEGSEVDIWSLDPDTGAFAIVGVGKVSGSQILTVAGGGVRQADWHLISQAVLISCAAGSLLDEASAQFGISPSQCSQDQAMPLDIPLETDKCSASDEAENDCDCTEDCADKSSGNLVIEHNLLSDPSVPAGFGLVYNSITANPEPIVNADATVSQSISSQLRVGGAAIGQEQFTNTSQLDENRDQSIRQTVSFEAKDLATGIYPYDYTLKSNYPVSAVSNTISGKVIVNNQDVTRFSRPVDGQPQPQMEKRPSFYQSAGGNILLDAKRRRQFHPHYGGRQSYPF